MTLHEVWDAVMDATICVYFPLATFVLSDFAIIRKIKSLIHVVVCMYLIFCDARCLSRNQIQISRASWI